MFEEKSFVLSDQFIGSVMMSLQKGIVEGVDITDVLRSFVVKIAPGDPTQTLLYVNNPPEISFEGLEEEADEGETE